jgi:hypothetical protein
MGTALTGLEIRDTYDALIKITDNGPIGATAKLLSDGLGNDSVLTLSTTSVGVGGDTSGTVSGVTINAKFCVKSEGTVSGAGFVYANDTTAANGSVIYACRSRGTIASPTAVVSGDRLASLIFAGNDGTDLALAAQINIEADGTVGANDMPGRITFLTTPDGTQAPTEKMRIANDGKLKFNSYGSGTITGTAAYNLGVDASGNVIELPGGVIDGAGTANYVPKWTDANTLGDSQLFDNGTSVGIGTATPAAKLDVVGTLAVSGNATFDTNTLFVDATNNRVGIGNASPLNQLDLNATGAPALFDAGLSGVQNGGTIELNYIASGRSGGRDGVHIFKTGVDSTGGTERMRITGTGNVGIGTSSPASTLDVVGTLAVSGAGVVNGDLRTNATLQVGNPNVVGNKVIQITPSTTTTPANIQGVWAGTGAYDVTLQTSGGNVGIGTASPSDKLMVSGDIGLYNSVASGSETNKIVFRNGIYTIAQIKSIVGLGQLNRGELAFDVDNGAGLGTAMYIDRTRNVGIGTTTPSANLEVYSASSSLLTLNGIAATEGAILTLKNRAATQFSADKNICQIDTYLNSTASESAGGMTRIKSAHETSGQSASFISFSTSPNAGSLSEKLRITSAGNVGIGTNAPAATLDVVGSSSSELAALRLFNSRVSGGEQQSVSILMRNQNTVGNFPSVKLIGQESTADSNLAEFIVQASNDNGANLVEVFRTATAGAGGAPYLRMAASTGGIQFNGDTLQVNALNDYEEGTFTPSFAFGGASTGITYFDRVGVYTKIGRQVTCTIYLAMTDVGSATGNASLEGLPFANANVNRGSQSAGSIRFDNITYGGSIMITVPNSSTNILFQQVSEAGADTTLTNANFSASSEMSITITYFTA